MIKSCLCQECSKYFCYPIITIGNEISCLPKQTIILNILSEEHERKIDECRERIKRQQDMIRFELNLTWSTSILSLLLDWFSLSSLSSSLKSAYRIQFSTEHRKVKIVHTFIHTLTMAHFHFHLIKITLY